LIIEATTYAPRGDFFIFYDTDGLHGDPPKLEVRASDVREIRDVTADG
jgi:hypothetical protein